MLNVIERRQRRGSGLGRVLHLALGALVCLSVVQGAWGQERASHHVNVRNLVRPAGYGESVLETYGLVVGLAGTGDQAEDAVATAKALANHMRQGGMEVISIDELTAGRGVALVHVMCRIPPAGAKRHDKFDVIVTATGNGGASSLVGGTLVAVPMFAAGKAENKVWAWAAGRLDVDPAQPLIATVSDGAQMIDDVDMPVVEPGGNSIRLILNEPLVSYENAEWIAGTLNNELSVEGEHLAKAVDAHSVVVVIPPLRRDNPQAFLADVMSKSVPMSLIRTPARVVIDAAKKTISVSGDVRIRPTAVSYEGLSLQTITPQPTPTASNPLIQTERVVGVTTETRDTTSLNQLLQALQALDVPVEGQMAIIYSLEDNGAIIGEVTTKN
ncbi:MAG: flagellar basal body P-ring protein FlgI [Phycisphaerales bacterium JB038]